MNRLFRFPQTTWLHMTWLVSAVAVLGLAGCATTSDPEPMGPDASDAALIRGICTDVMGLESGPQWDICTGSLADSLRRKSANERLARAHASCEQQDVAPETPAFDTCVVLAWQADATQRDRTPSSAPPAPTKEPVPRISFFKMDPRLKHEREQLACAQVGIDPVQYEFAECVADLQQAFFDFDNPL